MVIAGENSQKDGVFPGWHFLAKTLGDLKRAARKEVTLGRATNGTYRTHGTNGSAPAGFFAPLLPDVCHAFTDATFINKIALKPPDLLVEEIIRLVDETDGNIRYNLTWTRFAEIAEIAVIQIRLRRQPPNEECLPAVLLPQSMLS